MRHTINPPDLLSVDSSHDDEDASRDEERHRTQGVHDNRKQRSSPKGHETRFAGTGCVSPANRLTKT